MLDRRTALGVIAAAALAPASLGAKQRGATSLLPGNDILMVPGQSNGVGEGIGDWSGPPPDPRVFQVGRYGADNMQLIPAVRPLQYWTQQKHGFDLSLACYIAAKYLPPQRNLVIVPAGCGGTSILQWLGLDRGNGDDLYADQLARVRLCLALPGTNRIIGYFEQQGEADIQISLDPNDPRFPLMPDPPTYGARKVDLIDALRRDLGMFPMFFGLFTHRHVGEEGLAQIEGFEDAIRAAASSRPRCFVTGGMSDLLLNCDVGGDPDDRHFSASSQETMAALHFRNFMRSQAVARFHL